MCNSTGVLSAAGEYWIAVPTRRSRTGCGTCSAAGGSWSRAPSSATRPSTSCCARGGPSGRPPTSWAWTGRPWAGSPPMPTPHGSWSWPPGGQASWTCSSPGSTAAGTRASPMPPPAAVITAQGWTGSVQAVERYVRQFRTADGRSRAGRNPRQAPPPKTRQVTRWLLTHPDHLDPADQARLDAARAQCPHLDALAHHVRAFAKIMTLCRSLLELDGWLAQARPATCLSSAPSPTASAATSRPSPPAFPCPTALPPWRETSTRSFCGIRIVKSALPGLGGHRRSGGWWRWPEGRVAGASARPAWECRRAGPAACRGRRCRRRRRPARPR